MGRMGLRSLALATMAVAPMMSLYLHQVAVMTKAVVTVCLHQVAVERWWTTLMRIRRCAK